MIAQRFLRSLNIFENIFSLSLSLSLSLFPLLKDYKIEEYLVLHWQDNPCHIDEKLNWKCSFSKSSSSNRFRQLLFPYYLIIIEWVHAFPKSIKSEAQTASSKIWTQVVLLRISSTKNVMQIYVCEWQWNYIYIYIYRLHLFWDW